MAYNCICMPYYYQHCQKPNSPEPVAPAICRLLDVVQSESLPEMPQLGCHPYFVPKNLFHFGYNFVEMVQRDSPF
ncbi:hypothetical protein K7X08_035474 [Anisodus acutangulus]|uniref:Uncharacterized protein n=1 Tax=Anisodus acutangulus TaxID=402998 RepID=A0A9Q1LHG8_9SOLA|nr:hypothetical protein K7X08_035474 [Anisodus acutangulus]